MKKILLKLAGTALLVSVSIAQNPALAVDVQLAENLLMFNNASSVTITGPGGYSFQSSGDSPDGVAGSLSFVSLDEAGILADGHYTYEIREIVYGGTETVNDPANGRENVSRRIVVSEDSTSGTFLVQGGTIVVDDGTPEPE